MSYFTETLNFILEVDKDDVKDLAINSGKVAGRAVTTTALTGNPIAGAKAGMDELKYPYEITYVDANGTVYHGKMACTVAKKDYIFKKTKGQKLSIGKTMELNNKIDARINMALAYEHYDLNKALNLNKPKEEN